MDSIDKILSDLKEEYESPGEKAKVKPLPESPKPLKSSNQTYPTYKSPLTSANGDSIDRLLSDVKGDFEQQDLAVELQKQQELEKKSIREERIKVERRKALESKAKEWLKNLDTLSPEGLWFEKFAEGYPSRLEAGIDYLQGN
ncbi:MAG: hypothetical protein AAF378_17930 [Cyanobacteria bacterium P01_A01_bin.84]